MTIRRLAARQLIFLAVFTALLWFTAVESLAQPGSTHVVADPPLTPAEQLKKFRLPPGFEIQLVAAEPEIRKPINLNFDDAGRLYATGSIEYPFAATDPSKARDTVTRFTIGRDGRTTKSETVVTGLNIPIGIAPIGDELLVYSIPQVLRCRDLDNDGVFEDKQPLLKGFGFKDTHGMVNGMTPWIDGWIYSCHGFSNESDATAQDGSHIKMQSGNTFRWRPDGSHVEYFTHGQVNPFGLTFDPHGNVYSTDCHTLPAYQLLRGAWYPSFGKPHDGLGYGPPMMKHQHGSTGLSGIVYYAATQFPPEYRDTLFIGNPITARVNHDKLRWHGTTPEAIEQPDFIACDDRWFRPVDLKLGPDGALYIADFYNCIIGHYEVPLDHPQRDRERGRIWRVVYTGKGIKDTQPVEPPTPTDLTKLSFDELVEQLGNDNLAVRVLATNRLARQKLSEDELTKLRQISERGEKEWQRIHAAWVLTRQQADRSQFEPYATGDSVLTHVHLIKRLGLLAKSSRDVFLTGVHQDLQSAEPRVCRAATELLSQWPDRANYQPLIVALAQAPAEDTHLVHALRIALREQLLHTDILRSKRWEDSPGKVASLASILPAIPTADAASSLSQIIDAGNVDTATLGTAIEHVIRYLPQHELETWLTKVSQIQSGSSERQEVYVRGITRGAQARGIKLSDKVLNWREVTIHQAIESGDTTRIQWAFDLVRDAKQPEFFDDIYVIALSQKRYPSLRPAAIDACVACDVQRAIPLLGGIISDGKEPLGIRQKSAQALGSINQAAARTLLVEQFKTAPERLSIEIAVALGATAPGAETLLAAATAGKAPAALLQDEAVVRSLRRSKLPQLDERIAKLTAGLPPKNDRLRTLIDARRQGFAKHTAQATAGQAVFKKICANCHRVSGEGQKIGPELDGVGLRGLDRILEDVLDPSRAVDQAFRATVITTTDGRTLTGLAQRREGAVQLLIDLQGKELRIPVAEIEEQAVLPLSPMPANVADLLPEGEFYDLLAFLLSQQQKREIEK